MQYLGAFVQASLVPFSFNTRDLSGEGITFGGTPRLEVLDASDLSVIEGTLTPSLNVGTVTGRHLIVVDTDQAGYTGVEECIIAVQSGTVDGVDVTGEQLARFSLTTGTLPAGSITNTVLADNALSASKIASAAITAAKFGAGAIDAAAIADNAIDAGAIASNAITSAKIADGAFTAAKFAAGAFDAVWSVATRLLTAGTNIVLAKGTGVTGFTDLDAAGVRTAVGLASANLDTQLSGITSAQLSAAGVRSAIGLAAANLDTQLAALASGQISAAGVRSAIGLAAANLDTQLAALDALIDNIQADTDNIQTRLPTALDADGNLYAHARRIGGVKLGTGGSAPASPIGEIA